jgi:hypothetical protein
MFVLYLNIVIPKEMKSANQYTQSLHVMDFTHSFNLEKIKQFISLSHEIATLNELKLVDELQLPSLEVHTTYGNVLRA